jgi:hypothetical protein
MNKLPSQITIGDKYSPAMEITDQSEADSYFEKCVEHCMSFGETREKAEGIERENLGYFAGYCDHETRKRVERLFKCEHPIFGKAEKHVPTYEEALNAGIKRGKAIASAIEKSLDEQRQKR